MKFIVNVEGMHCEHCANTVKAALEAIDGVKSAKVNLQKKCAVVTSEKSLSSDLAKKAVDDAGFEFKGCEEKKGWF